jgi:pimeloyl-ACP methyl ester carboxylesterase
VYLNAGRHIVESGKRDDPITSDPQPVDWDFPPTIATVVLNSQGDAMNGILYISQGRGPHPTVILLHGYPGDEKNLDLAQAIRRTGWNVLFFHYRGAWGSAGAFSTEHALEDVAAALDFLQQPDAQRNYRVDAGKIVLVGHSMGAYLALLAGSRLDAIQHIVAMAPVNMGLWTAGAGPEMWAAMADNFEAMAHGAIKRVGGAEEFAQMTAHPDAYDLVERAAGLDGKSLLLIGAARDQDVPPEQHLAPLVKRLKERGKANITEATLDTDHVFSTTRIGLARLVAQWLAGTLTA